MEASLADAHNPDDALERVLAESRREAEQNAAEEEERRMRLAHEMSLAQQAAPDAGIAPELLAASRAAEEERLAQQALAASEREAIERQLYEEQQLALLMGDGADAFDPELHAALQASLNAEHHGNADNGAELAAIFSRRAARGPLDIDAERARMIAQGRGGAAAPDDSDDNDVPLPAPALAEAAQGGDEDALLAQAIALSLNGAGAPAPVVDIEAERLAEDRLIRAQQNAEFRVAEATDRLLDLTGEFEALQAQHADLLAPLADLEDAVEATLRRATNDRERSDQFDGANPGLLEAAEASETAHREAQEALEAARTRIDTAAIDRRLAEIARLRLAAEAALNEAQAEFDRL
jgi:hypothetical protein